MGTIADLLGIDLQAALGQSQDEGDATVRSEASDGTGDEGGDEGGSPQVSDHGSHATPGLGERGESAPEGGHTVTTDEVVMSAVLAETSLDPALAREDLTLAGDLDLDTIGLYAVVTSTEHGLGA
ncbi:MAG: hypothetical protein L0H81_06275, partial [Actinomyces sp.]|nr:hypothetical protein [Actinomyces sp.]